MLNIKTNSKEVNKGDTFVAIKGHTVDGRDYIFDAIKRGASKIVYERGGYDVETEVVDDTEKFLNDYLVSNYSKYFKDMNIIGITGTNGKTTTAYLTSQILTKLGVSNVYIGTIGYYVNSKKVKELPNTTPDILSLYNLILDAKGLGVNTVVMEVSSHSLDLGRVNGLEFKVGAFTNLTRDHLDYHKSMDNYLLAKKKILNHLSSDSIMLSNIDDEKGLEFKSNNFKTYGIGRGDYNVCGFNYSKTNTYLSFMYDNKYYQVETNLLGKFNVYNYMLSLGIVNSLGYSIEDIIRVTPSIYAPSGRNEIIKVRDSICVIDYAHTPDAVEKIILNNRETTKGRVISVLGCGGDRDNTKRPIMGDISTKLSDYVILTNDNPRTEDEKKIMRDIVSGISRGNYEVIFDRREAILKGLSMLEIDDILLILGKGHEDYQIIGREKIHFSDKEVVEEYVNSKVLKKTV